MDTILQALYSSSFEYLLRTNPRRGRHLPPSSDLDDGGSCQLLGPFALLVQASMGLIAVSTLVIKRHREHPPRPWKIWFFDVSKQVMGAGTLHMVNLLLSIISSNNNKDLPDSSDNPCDWYFLNILWDTTLGIPLLWFFLYWIQHFANSLKIQGIISGQYGYPPKWSAYFKQAALFLFAMILMKIVIYIVFQYLPWLDDVAKYLLSWTYFNPHLQIGFVVFVFPMIMNTLQYYLVDTIIKSPEYNTQKVYVHTHHTTLPTASNTHDGTINGPHSIQPFKHIFARTVSYGTIDPDDTEAGQFVSTLDPIINDPDEEVEEYAPGYPFLGVFEAAKRTLTGI
ncbi:hypothetical protein NADFUDRAFT_47317 [Nadsonia fulvescens var. elongata DSM 6958]|uniref:Vacuolar membrane protein n=1 Tax=Nadsonia fulvescens var. elongata DSM 6958 TaxID=857566 RepID=A0A1E3PH23_9ASCO|nr:hypothetical protein NADFUDRAFT_47317 [Nadsonia fulvescens var. elongata DSM 6958]